MKYKVFKGEEWIADVEADYHGLRIIDYNLNRYCFFSKDHGFFKYPNDCGGYLVVSFPEDVLVVEESPSRVEMVDSLIDQLNKSREELKKIRDGS